MDLNWLYSETHEWACVIGDRAYIGITAQAVSQLGDMVYLGLPKVGTTIQAGQEMAVIESTKAATDIYSPLSGTVVAVHDRLCNHLQDLLTLPESIDEHGGWFIQIQLTNPCELDQLMQSSQYRALFTTKCSL